MMPLRDIHNVHHVQAKCDILYRTLDDAIEYHFPQRIVKLHQKDKPWMTSEIKALIKKRQVLFKKGDLRWKAVRNNILRLIVKAKNH